jgi:phospholipid/cholesterol/gamma-HCH transport system substrate-binding protein
LTNLPQVEQSVARVVGTYGDWANLYLCDVTLMLNGLQPGGPVRTVKLWQQPTGRCTPQ